MGAGRMGASFAFSPARIALRDTAERVLTATSCSRLRVSNASCEALVLSTRLLTALWNVYNMCQGYCGAGPSGDLQRWQSQNLVSFFPVVLLRLRQQPKRSEDSLSSA